MRRFVAVVFMLFLAAGALAQESAADKQAGRPDPNLGRSPYRLDYVIKELDENKVINSRSYSMVLESTNDSGGRNYSEVKAGSRVPIITNNKEGQPSTVYMDVGVNLQAALSLRTDGNLQLNNQAEISSLVTSGAGTLPGNPIVRSVRSQTTSELTPGKPHLISSVDDPVSTHRFQIEVTATKLR